jgi:hypothetical protein
MVLQRPIELTADHGKAETSMAAVSSTQVLCVERLPIALRFPAVFWPILERLHA